MNRFYPLAPYWIALATIATATVALRYGLVERSDIGHYCATAGAAGWCPLRELVVLGFLRYGYGWTALLSTLLALLWRRPGTALLAAACGAYALILYCFEAGALALLAGSLLLVRAGATRGGLR